MAWAEKVVVKWYNNWKLMKKELIKDFDSQEWTFKYVFQEWKNILTGENEYRFEFVDWSWRVLISYILNTEPTYWIKRLWFLLNDVKQIIKANTDFKSAMPLRKVRKFQFTDYYSENSRKILYAGANKVIDLYESTADRFIKSITKPAVTEAIDSMIYQNNEIKVAIIGRVNVGKSSLLNALIGEERSVVSDVAGTTVDPVDEQFVYKDKLITFVDTAGIRKRGKIEGIERHALQRTQKMLETADVALLVIDSSQEFKELDEKIAHLVDKFGLGVMVVLNKWDEAMYDYDKSVEKVRDRFKFLSYAPVVTISALSHKRVHKLNDMILKIYANYAKRIPTSKLNEAIKIANSRHHLPSDNGQVVKIYFATQFDTKPPRIALIMNRPKSLHFSTKRYLVNQLRGFFDFEGTQILLEPKKKKSDEDFDSWI